MFSKDIDCGLETGLSAAEVDRRLMSLARAERRVEAALCFYLQEVERRGLYREFGFANTKDYARERFGLEPRKTQTLLYMARRFAELPQIEARFRRGDITWTKVRELMKVATQQTETEWLDKADQMSNRQLEEAVRDRLPPVQMLILKVALKDERAETWVQVKEAYERRAGKTLSVLEVFDLLFAEALCNYATTPPFGPLDEPAEAAKRDAGDDRAGYFRLVAERDGFQCSRPGCTSRTLLTGSHIVPRSQGGSDDPSNIHTACLACHQAIESGQLKVSGRAPDQLTWEGPFGVIEKPLPLSPQQVQAKLKELAQCPEESNETPPERTHPERPLTGTQMAELIFGPRKDLARVAGSDEPVSDPFDLDDAETRSRDRVVRDRAATSCLTESVSPE